MAFKLFNWLTKKDAEYTKRISEKGNEFAQAGEPNTEMIIQSLKGLYTFDSSFKHENLVDKVRSKMKQVRNNHNNEMTDQQILTDLTNLEKLTDQLIETYVNLTFVNIGSENYNSELSLVILKLLDVNETLDKMLEKQASMKGDYLLEIARQTLKKEGLV